MITFGSLAVIGNKLNFGRLAERRYEGFDIIDCGIPVQVAQSNLVNLGHLK